MRPSEFLEEYYEKKKKESQLPQQEISDDVEEAEKEFIKLLNGKVLPTKQLTEVAEHYFIVGYQEGKDKKTTSEKWKEYQDWLNEPPEISDEEIEKGAKEWYNKEGAYSASAIALKTWVYAIRWYREQLKQIQ